VSTPVPSQHEKLINGLLLGSLVLCGVLLVREGAHYDNVVDEGWRFFATAFFFGTLVGFVAWTQIAGLRPAFRFSGSYRHPWLAGLVVGLAFSSGGSYVNRTFSTPTERTVLGAIESVEEGKGTRWHVTVKTSDGRYQRYLVAQEVALALKNEKMVRLGISHGSLGFDFVARFEPYQG